MKEKTKFLGILGICFVIVITAVLIAQLNKPVSEEKNETFIQENSFRTFASFNELVNFVNTSSSSSRYY